MERIERDTSTRISDVGLHVVRTLFRGPGNLVVYFAGFVQGQEMVADRTEKLFRTRIVYDLQVDSGYTYLLFGRRARLLLVWADAFVFLGWGLGIWRRLAVGEGDSEGAMIATQLHNGLTSTQDFYLLATVQSLTLIHRLS